MIYVVSAYIALLKYRRATKYAFCRENYFQQNYSRHKKEN